MVPEISKLPPTRTWVFFFFFFSGGLAFSRVVSTETKLAIDRVVMCLQDLGIPFSSLQFFLLQFSPTGHARNSRGDCSFF
jgi:hypothetical protein